MRSGKMREGSYLLEIRLKPEQMEDLFSEMGRKWEGLGESGRQYQEFCFGPTELEIPVGHPLRDV